MNTNKKYTITNRSAGTASYSLPDINVKRFFNVGETKKNISFEEIEKLLYTDGGKYLLTNVLKVEEEVLKELDMDVEPEYHMSNDDVKELLLHGSYDAFLDALDFAPEGVKELIKDYAVSLPATDLGKLNAIKEKLGYDATAAIKNNQMLSMDSQATETEAPKKRRVVAEEAPKRRTTTNYKVVNTEN